MCGPLTLLTDSGNFEWAELMNPGTEVHCNKTSFMLISTELEISHVYKN